MTTVVNKSSAMPLAILPIMLAVAGAITTWIAFSTSDGLVAQDYYKQGLAVKDVYLGAIRQGLGAHLKQPVGQQGLDGMARVARATSLPPGTAAWGRSIETALNRSVRSGRSAKASSRSWRAPPVGRPARRAARPVRAPAR